MKNLMDEYIDFTSKKIKKYIRIILKSKYDEEIVEEFLKTYINSRYYNITEENSRPFYLKITDSLNEKQEILNERFEMNNTIGEKADTINGTKQIFSYMLFFDKVRKVENFKNIQSIREIIVKLIDYCKNVLNVNISENTEEVLYNEITSDMLNKDIYLDNFETNDFSLNFQKTEEFDTVYYTKLDYNMRLPMQFSEAAINKVYNLGTVAENKLVIEYELLSVVALRDVLDGNFKDKYIAEFTDSLFKKKQKLEGILAIINNQILQDKIYINITYGDFEKNRLLILGYIKEGYNFTIELDDYVTDIEKIKKLGMFKFVLLPNNIKLYKEILKCKKQFANILEK